MAKQIAFLEYSFIFDPSETWSNGYQFENQLADFFAAYGFEAQIVATTGGTGRRVIFINKVNEPQMTIKDTSKPATNDIKQAQTRVAPKDFKQFKNPRHPQIVQPKPSFQIGKTNRMKVRY